jgi:hypothetical protein
VREDESLADVATDKGVVTGSKGQEIKASM